MIRHNEVTEQTRKRIVELMDRHGPLGPIMATCACGILMDEKVNEGLRIPIDFDARLKYLDENKELNDALLRETSAGMRYYVKVALEVWLYTKADEAVRTLMEQYIFMDELGLDKLEGM